MSNSPGSGSGPDRKAQNTAGENQNPVEERSAIGSLLVSVVPSGRTLLGGLLGTLVFSGLSLIAAGGTLVALSFSPEVALLVIGVFLLVLAVLIAQIATRRGVL
jgi:hypothetical protein